MKKFIVLILILCFAVAPLFAGATSWSNEIKSKPNANWFSGSITKDFGWQWMKAADLLLVANLGIGDASVFYVNSNVTTEGDGQSWESAKDTTDEGINLCSAGDFVFVAEAHAESGSAADLWDADVAGITIVHFGNGARMGTYTYADTDTTIAIGAANVRVIGGRYLAGISEVVVGISVEAAGLYFELDGAEFPEPTTSTFEFNIAIQLTTAGNDVTVRNCKAYSADATGADHWLNGGAGVVNRLTIVNNVVHGEFAIAAIFSDQIDLEVLVANNTITNMTTGQHAVEFTAAATGTARDNALSGDTVGTILDPGSMRTFGNIESAGVDDPSIPTPAFTTGNSAEVGKVYTITATSDATASTDNLWLTAGGAIEIISLFGECTTAASGSPGTMVIEMDATAGANFDSDFSTTVNVDALGEGDVVKFSGATDEGVLSIAANTAAGQTLSWFAPAGMIEQTLSSTGTFAIKWYMTFRVMESGVTVTTQ